MDPKKERPQEEDPFKDLKISNWRILEDINERQRCLVCKKSRKYFCYNCYVPVQDLQQHVPRLKLPIKIDILKHSREIDGKSTAAHAAVLAPEDVSIYTYPCIPQYGTHEKVVLVFPGNDAISVEKLFDTSCELRGDNAEPKPKRLNVGKRLPVTRAIFIDSTWNQSRGIYKDQRLKGIPCVILQSRISQFWRHQNGSPRWYLATVEAIHQFLVEFHRAAWKSNNHITEGVPNCGEEESGKVLITNSLCTSESENNSENKTDSSEHSMEPIANFLNPYNGEYDNLLFFFRYMYSKIHKLYDHEDLRAYKRPLK